MFWTTSTRLFGCGVVAGAVMTALLTPARGRVVRKRVAAAVRRSRKHGLRVVRRTQRTFGPDSEFVRTVREHGAMAVVH